ncbi:MAG: hypothetical protein IT340_17180 [Chloroflexi bacterium]|nr:hypothetical protein [Chloroflexota bacterium]
MTGQPEPPSSSRSTASVVTGGDLRLPVTDDLVLDAGHWETRYDRNGQVSRLIEPPRQPLFRQVIAYLEAHPPAGLPRLSLQDEGRCIMAVCLRWGSYLAVLMDRSKPRSPEAGQTAVSQIDDTEMMRINIEASAALAWWLDCLRNDSARYYRLIASAIRLPMSKQRSPADRLAWGVLSQLADPELAARIVAGVSPDWRRTVRDQADRRPTRLLANTLINTAWRNNDIETIHAGTAGAYPLLAQRITAAQEHQLVRATVDRLVTAVVVTRQLITSGDGRDWPERVLLFGMIPWYTPYDWSLDEESCAVELVGGEPALAPPRPRQAQRQQAPP